MRLSARSRPRAAYRGIRWSPASPRWYPATSRLATGPLRALRADCGREVKSCTHGRLRNTKSSRERRSQAQNAQTRKSVRPARVDEPAQAWHLGSMHSFSNSPLGKDLGLYAHSRLCGVLVGTRKRGNSRLREAGQRHVRRGTGPAGSVTWNEKKAPNSTTPAGGKPTQ